MRAFRNLTAFALRQLAEAAGVREGGEAVLGVLSRHFLDHSQRLTVALRFAVDRSWKALEISLAGESLVDKLSRTEDRQLWHQIRSFLEGSPDVVATHDPAFRQRCLQELRAARKSGRLTAGEFDAQTMARQACDFARFSEPQAILDAEISTLDGIALEIRDDFPNLAFLLMAEPVPGRSLLVVSVRYYFRRAVEEDRELFQGLTFTQLERLEESQERGFASLDASLKQQRQRLEAALGEIQSLAVETHGAVLDIHQQVGEHGEMLRQVREDVERLLEQHQLHSRELRPGDSLSIRGDDERQLVKQLIARYRSLPEGEREKVPALLNAIGKLEVVAGDYRAARRDFKAVVMLERNEKGRAEAHYNAFLAAMEDEDLQGAWQEFINAVRLDGKRFATFPVGKYIPERILGAGGFGVAFLCKHKYMNAPVVVKTLTQEGLGRDADKVFTEAQVLRQLDHPNIIRISECGYVDASRKAKPFLVMDYFDGLTVEQQVEANGKLSVEDALLVMKQVAEGLKAAHGKGIMHRDVKPANILVRRDGDAWKVKLIDFGLALRQGIASRSIQARDGAKGKTILGASIAGTVEYAAPEQMGRGGGVPAGPYSDVYGFAKTCCYALFRTTRPLRKHWDEVPSSLVELLEGCLDEDPRKRPQTFEDVIAWIDSVRFDKVRREQVTSPPYPVPVAVERELLSEPTAPPEVPSPPAALATFRSANSGIDGGESSERRVMVLGILSAGAAVLIVLVGLAILLFSGSGGKQGQASGSFGAAWQAPIEQGNGSVRFLSDMSEFDVKVSEGRFAKRGSLGYSAGQYSKVTVDGKESPNGLSMCPGPNTYASASYRLDGQAAAFLASVALNDSAGTIATGLTFEVLGDGKVLWRSLPVNASRRVQDCEVNVRGVNLLELRIDCPGSHVNAQAVWLEPRLRLR